MGGRGKSSGGSGGSGGNTGAGVMVGGPIMLGAGAGVAAANAVDISNIPTPITADDLMKTSDNAIVRQRVFRSMTSDQQAGVIADALSKPYPSGLPKTDYQKFMYYTGLDSQFNVVSDSALDAMPGESLYRTVGAKGKNHAISIADNMMHSDVTFFSDSGGSAHGRGFYMAEDSVYDSAVYGGGVSSIMIRAKYSSSTKVISESTNNNNYYKEITSGSSLGKVLSSMDSDDGASIYALMKGYDVIKADRGSSYRVVLNRSTMSVSDTAAMGRTGNFINTARKQSYVTGNAAWKGFTNDIGGIQIT